MEPEEYDGRDHHGGDGDEDEDYAVGVCEILVKTANTTISIVAPDSATAQELSAIALKMAANMQTNVQ